MITAGQYIGGSLLMGAYGTIMILGLFFFFRNIKHKKQWALLAIIGMCLKGIGDVIITFTPMSEQMFNLYARLFGVLLIISFLSFFFLEIRHTKLTKRIILITTIPIPILLGIYIYTLFYNIKMLNYASAIYYLYFVLAGVEVTAILIYSTLKFKEFKKKRSILIFCGVIIEILYNVLICFIISFHPSLERTLSSSSPLLLVLFFFFALLEDFTDILNNLKIMVAEQTEELRKMQKLHSEYLITIFHNVANPLRDANISFEVILEEQKEAEKLAGIHNAYQDVLGRIEHFRNVETATNGESVYDHSQRIDLNALIIAKERSQRFRFRNRGIALTISTIGEATAEVDAFAVESILDNLIENALEHTPRGGEVVLRAHRDEVQGYAVLRVGDSGTGMTPKRLAEICSDEWEGREAHEGMGLRSIRSILSQCGGEFKVESREGEGTVCSVLFPLGPRFPVEEDDDPEYVCEYERDEALERFTVPGKDRPDLLLVDDFADILIDFRLMLRGYFKVKLAHSVRNAIEVIEGGFRPDCVLCDQILGAEERSLGLRSYLEKEGLGATPFVVMSMWSDKSAGKEAFVGKPLDIAEVMEALKEAAAQK